MEDKGRWFSLGGGLAITAIYVGSLYVLVPERVRLLPRDDPVHVRAKG